jgi:hypothetical protein
MKQRECQFHRKRVARMNSLFAFCIRAMQNDKCTVKLHGFVQVLQYPCGGVDILEENFRPGQWRACGLASTNQIICCEYHQAFTVTQTPARSSIIECLTHIKTPSRVIVTWLPSNLRLVYTK